MSRVTGHCNAAPGVLEVCIVHVSPKYSSQVCVEDCERIESSPTSTCVKLLSHVPVTSYVILNIAYPMMPRLIPGRILGRENIMELFSDCLNVVSSPTPRRRLGTHVSWAEAFSYVLTRQMAWSERETGRVLSSRGLPWRGLVSGVCLPHVHPPAMPTRLHHRAGNKAGRIQHHVYPGLKSAVGLCRSRTELSLRQPQPLASIHSDI